MRKDLQDSPESLGWLAVSTLAILTQRKIEKLLNLSIKLEHI